jgi:hypothetical protein
MAYNLPPPWDAGYALPSNVKDEGLERRAFVTKQAPRGTYDDPRVGNGGYAVPQYVDDEGYGQGTFTTKWRARGTYDLPVPNWLNVRSKVVAEARSPGGGTQVTFQALSGTELPKLYTDFGAKAARQVIGRVMAVPAGQRKAMLKTILDRIDPTLWKRVASIAQALQRGGLSAGDALYPALAQAMSVGIAAEIVQTGLRRTAPQPRSLLGLGCYGALGATAAMSVKGSITNIVDKITGVFSNGESCPPPSGFTWDTANGTPYLRRLKAGESPKNGPCGGTVTTGGTSGQATVTSSETPRAGKILELGPSEARIWFRIPEQTGRFTMTQPGAASSTAGIAVGDSMMTPEIWADIVTQMQTASAKYRKLQAVTDADAVKDMKGDGYGLPPVSGNYLKGVIEGVFPLYWFTYPGSSTTFGLHVKYLAPGLWEFTTRQKPPSNNPLSGAFSWLKKLFAKITDVAAQAVEAVADLACKVAGSGVGVAAGAGAAAAAGVPPEAGAAGATIAAGVCNSGGQTGPFVMPPSADDGLLPLAIIGGVAAVAVFMLKKKKRKAP